MWVQLLRFLMRDASGSCCKALLTSLERRKAAAASPAERMRLQLAAEIAGERAASSSRREQAYVDAEGLLSLSLSLA